MRILTTSIVAAVVMAGASAQAATYDFKAAANAGGGIGESAYTSFDTTSAFAGPGLTITAGDEDFDGTPYVYFDNGNAGIGVCNDLNAAGDASVDTATNGSSNLCNPSGDDGITTSGEFLTFTAQSSMTIDGIWINSNHDNASIWDTVWLIAGETYSNLLGSFVDDSLSQDGDIFIDLGGFFLAAGDFFTVKGTSGANSYISGLAVTPVPLPAAGWLLIAGLGGLAAMRRKSA